MVFAGMLMRGIFEPGEPYGDHVVTWEKLTPQAIADALLSLREQKGDELRAQGLALCEVIQGM